MSLLFSNLVGLFILIGVGFFAVRARIVPESAVGPLTSLLMKITLPATIFSSFIRPFDAQFLHDSLVIIALGFLFFSLYAILSRPLSGLLRVREEGRGMWQLCATFCNNGFMGFPVAYALFGDEGLALAVMLGIPFNLLLYSLGVRMVLSDRQAAGEERVPLWRTLLTAVNGATVLGLVFYCLQLPVPGPVLTPIQHLANITTPLSMMVTGMKLAGGRAADVIRDRDAITASLVRLLAFPLLAWAVLGLLLIGNPLVPGVTLLIVAMPSPAAATILGEQYQGCTQLAARTVFLSSLFCLATLPLVALLL